MSSLEVVYEFAGLRLEPEGRRLTDATGREVPLPPRVFDTLLHLVERRGELVGKQALRQAVWGNTVVGDNSLDQNISLLRRALKERGASGRLLVTERGRGFRFVANVTCPAHREPSRLDSLGPRMPSGGSGASFPDERSRQLFDEAHALVIRPSPGNLRGALEILNAALERRPLFARALAERALLRTLFPLFDIPMPHARAIAEMEARHALSLYPTLARAHQALAYALIARGAWLEAREHFDAASRLEETPDAQVTRVWQLSQSVGHLRLALRQVENVNRKVPLLPLAAVGYTSTCTLIGMSEDALRSIDRAVALGWPKTQAPLPDIYFLVAIRHGRLRDAALCASEALNPAMRAAGAEKVITQMCEALPEPGRRPAAVAAMRRLTADVGTAGLGERNLKRALAWFTLLGALDDAFDLLDDALGDPECDGTIGGPWGWLWGPEMVPFRRNRRFLAVTRRLGFVPYWRHYGPPDGYVLSPKGDLVEVATPTKIPKRRDWMPE
ncbi:MAG TPA: winged helix-turn-helix domain-containing protein [Steroidobacteraceae bacterium]